MTTRAFVFFAASVSGPPDRRARAAAELDTGRFEGGTWPLMNMLRSFVAVTSVRIFAGVFFAALTWGGKGRAKSGGPLVNRRTGRGVVGRAGVREGRMGTRTFSARDDFDVSLSRRACRRARFASSIAIVRESLPTEGGRGCIFPSQKNFLRTTQRANDNDNTRYVSRRRCVFGRGF